MICPAAAVLSNPGVAAAQAETCEAQNRIPWPAQIAAGLTRGRDVMAFR